MLQLIETMSVFEKSLAAVQAYLNEHPTYRTSVLDVQVDESALIVLVDHTVSVSHLKTLLMTKWPGDVDVICANDIMAGSATYH